MRTLEAIAVAGTLALYRGTILPATRRELAAWRGVAETLPDPERRVIALAALTEKAANPEATALFAALAPRRHRRAALATSTALQVAIDYLDSLGERPATDPLAEGLRLHGALEAALTPGTSKRITRDEDPYIAALVAACRRGAAALPAGEAVLPVARHAAKRCGEGQSHTHGAATVPDQGAGALATWARSLDAPADYRWWEAAAGASSSVGAHALIALAADPAATVADAEAVDAAYFPAVGALTVILDDIVDRAADAAAGEHSYLDYYADPAEAGERLAAIVADAAAATPGLRRPARQNAILAGVVAYYVAALSGADPGGRSIAARVLAAAPPAAVPLSAVLGLSHG